MQKLEVTCHVNNLRIFIDSYKRSLKVVLLHNGDKYTSLPVTDHVQLKQTYMALLPDNTKYAEHNWLVYSARKLSEYCWVSREVTQNCQVSCVVVQQSRQRTLKKATVASQNSWCPVPKILST